MALLFSIKSSFSLFTAADMLSRSYSPQSFYMLAPDFRDHQHIQEVPAEAITDKNNMVRTGRGG